MLELDDYRNFVLFVANDYYELSYDKVKWQRDDWIKRARAILEKEAITYPDPDYGDDF